MNFLESVRASRILLPLGWSHKSASHIAHVLKNLETFRKLCPSSIFRVHGYEVSNCRVHEVEYHLFLFDGSWVSFTWTSMTERISAVILWNSSKHSHAPVCAWPLIGCWLVCNHDHLRICNNCPSYVWFCRRASFFQLARCY